MLLYIILSKSSDFELLNDNPILKDSEYRISSMLGQGGMTKTNPLFDGLFNFLQGVIPIYYYDDIGVKTNRFQYMEIEMTYKITVTK
jgi:hypothetical protein